ncbi:hypothetical protein PGTUg99_009089 [Puccinia graminis f. sp. tritici]|uniref:Uncharacterized protein n=1 Tax=Puccinia graminis f. sp. tritici TaxID=56615 RepID=A0A5B0NJ38_PUCGR|nr:hypothetical protein PGTUg99_009089 [Puccinia graminis f. sp. tritici]
MKKTEEDRSHAQARSPEPSELKPHLHCLKARACPSIEQPAAQPAPIGCRLPHDQ